MRFYMDEHIATAVADGLSRRGVDVLRAQDAGMTGAEDADHLALAHSQGRVLVTQDHDYLVLAHESKQHSGIAFITRQRVPIGVIVKSLLLLRRRITREQMRSRIEHLP